MGCCCCYLSDFRATRQAPPSLQRRPSSVEHRSFEQNVFHRAKEATKARYICDMCGADVDPILFDGHQEACRTNHLRAILAKNAALLSEANIQPSSSKFHYEGATGDKELCVVCMDQPRCYAFLPCGHISCCQECTKSLDQCPLCRQPREGLCQVSPNVTAQYECKHCHELIAPTLFDGHREVCGLRQRQMRREAEEAAAPAEAEAVAIGVPVDDAECSAAQQCSVKTALSKSPPVSGVSPPPTAVLPTTAEPTRIPAHSHSNVCLECGNTYSQLVVCAPCGHRVLCYTCARRRTTCPVCLSEIRDTIVAFD
ncbi:putative Zinc finger, C3HC4 type (RING finger) containing protein [Leishmania naiffi]|uniref:Zinc finger, C3HC4 type (RING finger) containing protein n=1 Tax=Leishmania naiffi TaxID=5678 RepID=A0AAW3B446_9TRYP